MSCKIGTQCFIDSNGIDVENKTIPVILSDESKVLRYSWDEGVYHIILDHKEDSVDLRRKDILPILLQHNTEMLPLGIYQNVRLEDDKLKADAKFDPEDEMAMEIFGKMSRGFMQTLSVGVTIHGKELEDESDEGNTYRATRWEITEASIVTVPAIPTAKVGLSHDEVTNMASMPTASDSNKIVKNQQGANMEFNEENFKALKANKETLDKRLETTKLQLETATAALETKDEELKALKADSDAKLSEAKEANDAFKSQVETRLNEAVETNVDVKTALSMVNASSDEDASNLAIDAKSNTEALKQDGQADKDAWADFE